MIERLPTRRDAIRRGKGLPVAKFMAGYASRKILVRYFDGDGQTTNAGRNSLDILWEFRVRSVLYLAFRSTDRRSCPCDRWWRIRTSFGRLKTTERLFVRCGGTGS